MPYRKPLEYWNIYSCSLMWRIETHFNGSRDSTSDSICWQAYRHDLSSFSLQKELQKMIGTSEWWGENSASIIIDIQMYLCENVIKNLLKCWPLFMLKTQHPNAIWYGNEAQGASKWAWSQAVRHREQDAIWDTSPQWGLSARSMLGQLPRCSPHQMLLLDCCCCCCA
jgi:hypothetical protein